MGGVLFKVAVLFVPCCRLRGGRGPRREEVFAFVVLERLRLMGVGSGGASPSPSPSLESSSVESSYSCTWVFLLLLLTLGADEDAENMDGVLLLRGIE